jgi:hypothetical protein
MATSGRQVSPQILEVTEELLQLKLLFKSLTGEWIISERPSEGIAGQHSEASVAQAGPAMERPQMSGGADGHEAAQSSEGHGANLDWSPAGGRVNLGLAFFRTGPLLVPDYLRWAWRLVMEHDDHIALQELRSVLQRVHDSSSIRAPLAAFFLDHMSQ